MPAGRARLSVGCVSKDIDSDRDSRRPGVDLVDASSAEGAPAAVGPALPWRAEAGVETDPPPPRAAAGMTRSSCLATSRTRPVLTSSPCALVAGRWERGVGPATGACGIDAAGAGPEAPREGGAPAEGAA